MDEYEARTMIFMGGVIVSAIAIQRIMDHRFRGKASWVRTQSKLALVGVVLNWFGLLFSGYAAAFMLGAALEMIGLNEMIEGLGMILGVLAMAGGAHLFALALGGWDRIFG